MRNVAILISSTEKAQIVAISYNRVIAPSTVEKCMADFYFRFQITSLENVPFHEFKTTFLLRSTEFKQMQQY